MSLSPQRIVNLDPLGADPPVDDGARSWLLAGLAAVVVAVAAFVWLWPPPDGGGAEDGVIVSDVGDVFGHRVVCIEPVGGGAFDCVALD